MKTWLFTSLYFIGVSIAYAKQIPYLLEVQKDTPFFSRPSMKSNRLAEAEVGTLLMLVEKSKRGIWVKLRDADGLEGWMPLDRTDYRELESARESLKQLHDINRIEKSPNDRESVVGENQKSREEMIEEVKKEQQAVRAQSETKSLIRLAPLVRWLSDVRPASPRMGLRIDYRLGDVTLTGNERRGTSSLAAEFSLPATQKNSSSNDYSGALRYVGMAPLWGPFVYGPDLGYSVDKVDKNFRHHLSAGLSVGIARGPFDVSIRGSMDFFAQSRSAFEIQMGVSF